MVRRTQNEEPWVSRKDVRTLRQRAAPRSPSVYAIRVRRLMELDLGVNRVLRLTDRIQVLGTALTTE
jgi:hypothetical protein